MNWLFYSTYTYCYINIRYVDILRSKDGTKNELEQLLTTLQHCEQTFIQSPQVRLVHTFVIDLTLLCQL